MKGGGTTGTVNPTSGGWGQGEGDSGRRRLGIPDGHLKDVGPLRAVEGDVMHERLRLAELFRPVKDEERVQAVQQGDGDAALQVKRQAS